MPHKAEFTPPLEKRSSISASGVAGIVAAAVAIILVVGILSWKGCSRQKSTLEQGIWNATNNFLKIFGS